MWGTTGQTYERPEALGVCKDPTVNGLSGQGGTERLHCVGVVEELVEGGLETRSRGSELGRGMTGGGRKLSQTKQRSGNSG